MATLTFLWRVGVGGRRTRKCRASGSKVLDPYPLEDSWVACDPDERRRWFSTRSRLAQSWRPAAPSPVPREPWRRAGRAVRLCAPGAVVGTRVEDRRQPGPGSPPRGAQCGLDVLGSGQSVPRGCRHALVLRGGTERAACCFHCFHPKLRRGGFVARSGQALHVKTQRFPSPPLS